MIEIKCMYEKWTRMLPRIEKPQVSRLSEMALGGEN